MDHSPFNIFHMRRIVLLFSIICSELKSQSIISFTFDDPNTTETPLLSPEKRNDQLLEALKKNKLKAALFVCGMRVDNAKGKKLLDDWDNAGHLIANHSYSHLNYSSKKTSPPVFRSDFIRGDSLISGYRNYRKLFRFPFLKEGNTIEKRDFLREVLDSMQYGNGHVTVDASDWYIDQQLIKALKKNPDTSINKFRDFYVEHIYERACFYDSLATVLTGKKIPHTLLLHHNLLNALFLNDLIQHFKLKGWKIIDAELAYRDSFFLNLPTVVPAGESLVWALAKSSGRFESVLRYPAEDAMYEEEKLLNFLKRGK
jgi:peptidoglycan-N-acetylglucosamine deacetylase